MKNKLKDHIDLIFADAPDCAKTREMKEEMYANVSDRYDDLIKEGKSESAAYNISISGIGDISELIDSLKRENAANGGNTAHFDEAKSAKNDENPYCNGKYAKKRVFTEKEKAEIEKYRVRRGVMNAIAVAMYIICWLPLVVIGVVTDATGGNDDIAAAIGICIMMLMIAAATILMIMKSSIKPLCLRGVKNSELGFDDGDDDDDDDDDDGDDERPRGKKSRRRKNPALVAISGALWAITVAVYLIVSFFTGAWHLTWLIFLIATAADNIIEALFEICGKRYI